MNENLLRYPGGKNRAVKILKDFIPKDTKEVVSIFYGGGSLERCLANEEIKIKAYDNFELLINFWINTKYNPNIIYDKILEIYNNGMTKHIFKQMQLTINEQDNLTKAAWFYTLNRCSFSGTILRGGSSSFQRFTISAIEKLKNYEMQNIEFECLDFKQSIVKHKNDFKYIDPPYYGIDNLYQDKDFSFDHDKLNEILMNTTNWILSYNDCEYVREKYKDYKIIELKWNYGMNKTKKSSEILILNY